MTLSALCWPLVFGVVVFSQCVFPAVWVLPESNRLFVISFAVCVRRMWAPAHCAALVVILCGTMCGGSRWSTTSVLLHERCCFVRPHPPFAVVCVSLCVLRSRLLLGMLLLPCVNPAGCVGPAVSKGVLLFAYLFVFRAQVV